MGDLQEKCCPVCFVAYAIPVQMDKKRRKDGRKFFCPNGHSLSYRDCENDRIRRERDRLKQQAAYQEDLVRQYLDEAEHQKRQAAAHKGQVTRLKNRAAAGVCPCCNRTFQNLQSHMKTKHPKYTDDETVVALKTA